MGFKWVVPYYQNNPHQIQRYIMHVHIGPYTNWFGPYQLAELLCFWVKKVPDEYGYKRRPDWVHDFGKWLAEDRNGNDSWLTKLCQWIESHKKRKIKVRIDNYDTWSMDHTLAHIILPMLKQLRDTKHGSPMVDLEDVPEHMRTTTTEDWDSQKVFDFYKENEPEGYDIHKRWEWVLNEMIFAFEHLLDDSWEEAYRSGHIDMQFVPCEDNPKLSRMVDGPNHTYQCDYDGMNKVYNRMDNGFRLFGKYYRGLWD
jgi:hypothetical protein